MRVAAAGDKGMGVYAETAAKAGTFVCQYVGTPVTLLQTAQRYVDSDPDYLFQINPDLYLDAMDSNHTSRFFNHAEHGNLNFTIDAARVCVDFYLTQDVEPGVELTFDYGMSYWLGAGITPLNDCRNYTEKRKTTHATPPGPRPLTPLTAQELDKLMGMDEPDIRAGLLRSLEFFGGSRLDEDSIRIPLGVGEGVAYKVVEPSTEAISTLEAAARTCVRQVAELQSAAATAADDDDDDDALTLPFDQVSLVERWQSRCPRFATAEHDAVGLGVLLLWTFPDFHGATDPLTREQWEALLRELREDEGGNGATRVRALLEVHAPKEAINALIDSTRRLA